MKLHELKLATAGAITAALCMLFLSVLSPMGLYGGAMEQMRRSHMFYGPTFGGTLAGMLEAALVTFVALYVFAAIYNALLRKP